MKLSFQMILAVVILSGSIFASPGYPYETAKTEKPVVYFGFIPLYTPHLMYEKFQPILDYLTANTPFRFKMRLAKDYKGIVAFLKDGSINVALLGGVSYIIARDNIELIPLLKPLNAKGTPFYRSVIVTRADKDIKNIFDLKGRSFAFASGWSTSGAVVPLYHMYSRGIELQGLSSYFHLRYQDSVVREVLKGRYDAGAVMDTTADLYREKGLRVVFVSEPIPELTIVAGKGASQVLINSIKKALLNINPRDPGHREMLRAWGEDIKYGFVEANDPDFDAVFKMMESLKGKGVYISDELD